MDNELLETPVAPSQKDIKALFEKIGEAIKQYIWDERSNVSEIAEKAGVSAPTVRALHPDSKAELKNVNFNKLISIVNAVGYTIEGITLKKIK